MAATHSRVLAATHSKVLAATHSRVLAATDSRVLAATHSRVLAATHSRVLAAIPSLCRYSDTLPVSPGFSYTLYYISYIMHILVADTFISLVPLIP